MKNLAVILLIAGVAGYFAYAWFSRGDTPLAALVSQPEVLPSKDAQGRDVVPCQRCLATGQITCTALRCKDGVVPCYALCLKLSDADWQRLEGQDPEKLFKIYRVKGGIEAVSQAHVGEVFEIRFGKLVKLGACKVCEGRTTLPCKACGEAGKVVCPVCRGEKVVLKNTPVPAKSNIPAQPPAQAAKIFRLKNGTTVTGTLMLRDKSVVWLRTGDGKKVELKTSEIVSER